jgi:hypothetical protein
MAGHGLSQLNALSAHAARDEFLRCCGSQECVAVPPSATHSVFQPSHTARPPPPPPSPTNRLATKLAAARPFTSVEDLNNAALRVWWTEVRALRRCLQPLAPS